MTEQVRQTGKKSSIDPIPKHLRIPKRWLEAKRKYGHSQQHLDNKAVEAYFMNTLFKVKQLLKEKHTTAFSRDYRSCDAENAFTMEVFICPSVYLLLECSYDYTYRVEYAFNNCKHEAEISKLLNSFVLQNRVKEQKLKPDFNTFYLTVMTMQDSSHFILL
jgi:hypothetical protein